MILFLQNKDIAADLRCCTGCLKACGTAADYDHIALLFDFQILIDIALRYCRVDGTADRTVDADPVACAANVAGNTFAQQHFLAFLDFLYPVRLCDQSAAHANDIHISALQNLLYDLRVTVVACVDDRFAKCILDRSCHVGTPSVRQKI